MYTLTAPDSTLEEKRQLVDAWMKTNGTIAPDAVYSAHLHIVPNGECADADQECRICTVYCDVCDHHYPFEDTCRFH